MMRLIDQYREEIFISMLDSDFGLFLSGKFIQSPFPFSRLSGYTLVNSDCSALGGMCPSVISGGYSLTPRAAVLKAFYEGLERSAFLMSDPRECVIDQSYTEIVSRAYTPHPSTWSLCASWQYDQPGFPIAPYREDLRMNWVEVEHAWRFDKEKVVVPTSLVRPTGLRSKNPLYLVSSSGCAFGWTVDEARERAILELIERDTLLICWRSRLPGTLISMEGLEQGQLKDLWTSLQVDSDQIKLQLLPNEFNIPVVCGILLGKGVDQPVAVVATAASFQLEEAILKALFELSQLSISRIESKIPLRNDFSEDASDDSWVEDFADHWRYFQCPDKVHHLRKFFGDEPAKSIHHLRTQLGTSPQSLSQLIEVMKLKKYDLMFRSFDTPELSRLDGYVERAICPPLVPLDSAHKIRAIGSARYQSVSSALLGSDTWQNSRIWNQPPHPLW